jgi:hypothetical protein
MSFSKTTKEKSYFSYGHEKKLQLRVDRERIRISKDVPVQSNKRPLLSIAKDKITCAVSIQRQTFVMEINKQLQAPAVLTSA